MRIRAHSQSRGRIGGRARGPRGPGRVRALLLSGLIGFVASTAVISAVSVPLGLRGALAGGATAMSTGGFPTPIRHVVVIFLENTEANTTLAGAPYQSYLASHYAYAGQFYAVHHYSLPDYLAATSGVVKTPSGPFAARNIADLV